MVDKEIGQLLHTVGIEMKKLNHPTMAELTPEQCRYYYKKGLPYFHAEKIQIGRVEDRLIDSDGYSLPIRIYTPESTSSSSSLPVLIYFHGGGWLFGDLDKDDAFCRYVAKTCQAIVVSVDYRLAPESKYPIPLQDALTATTWVFDHIASYGGDPQRVIISGESSGGNLATAASIKLRAEGKYLLHGQLLICPVLHCNFETDSYNAGYAYNLTKEKMQWFWQHYLEREEQGLEVSASPLLVEDASSLPQALIITAQLDPLRDEGAAYAEKLKQAGVPVRYLNFDQMVHSFVHMSSSSKQARKGLELVVQELNLMMNTASSQQTATPHS
ncbi:alpha/beta hydrolase [Mechercharimyces sp. CAU 1602]|uniref:alpha/beta hydrolase n=1 Tax=Mechercharimyces sp. CAU 1602 TaxID=2973933 RepID=UPI00216343D7|nr:alpha/beta hydrolase [Mechercharimyces sp. CAU 1602]MCS1352486.1 alpha/beta hydrolase [Mechercharimyces sp. CAU 1602]